MNLVAAAKQAGVKQIIYVSSIGWYFLDIQATTHMFYVSVCYHSTAFYIVCSQKAVMATLSAQN
eukprot:scaffold73554_cov20-Prasinocladus_malaysianus.AAC.1